MSEKPILDEPPPIMRTWGRLYGFVLCYLACVIAVFYWFTRTYAP